MRRTGEKILNTPITQNVFPDFQGQKDVPVPILDFLDPVSDFDIPPNVGKQEDKDRD